MGFDGRLLFNFIFFQDQRLISPTTGKRVDSGELITLPDVRHLVESRVAAGGGDPVLVKDWKERKGKALLEKGKVEVRGTYLG